MSDLAKQAQELEALKGELEAADAKLQELGRRHEALQAERAKLAKRAEGKVGLDAMMARLRKIAAEEQELEFVRDALHEGKAALGERIADAQRAQRAAEAEAFKPELDATHAAFVDAMLALAEAYAEIRPLERKASILGLNTVPAMGDLIKALRHTIGRWGAIPGFLSPTQVKRADQAQNNLR